MRTETHLARVIPHSKEFEKAIIAAIISEVIKPKEILSILDSGVYFYDYNYSELYNKVVYLANKGLNTDLLTLDKEIRKHPENERVFSTYELTQITESINPFQKVETFIGYAKAIKDLWRNRRLIEISNQIASMAFDGEHPSDVVYALQNEIEKLSIGGDNRQYVSIQEALKAEYDTIEHQINLDVQFNGVETGYSELNKTTGGWQSPDLIILAARPAVGKTAFALNLAFNAASDKPVLVASLEMGINQLTRRLISLSTGVKLSEVSRPYTIVDKDSTLHKIANDTILQNKKLYFDDSAGLTPSELRFKARQLKNKHGLGMVIIDYLQLMNSDHKGGNREQEISRISRDLKKMAKELDVPVMALSQLSRATEMRGGDKGKIPQLSDLRESGAIEQDADMVMFIYRPEYHGITNDENGNALEQGETHITIAKHRNGELKTLKFYADLSTQRFHDRPFTEEKAWSNNFSQQSELNTMPFGGTTFSPFEPVENPHKSFTGISPDDVPF